METVTQAPTVAQLKSTARLQIDAVREAAAILTEAFPDGPMISLDVLNGSLALKYHGLKTYAEATEWLRGLGCGDREKHPYPTYTQLSGESHGIRWTTFPDELPPSCRKVIKVERVPKTQTVETGEFIEIEREVIECIGGVQ